MFIDALVYTLSSSVDHGRQRAGFVWECLLCGYRVKKGRREDRVVLSLTASGLWS